MNTRDIPIIVLAAGASSRMRGADKLMEPVGTIPLIRKQAILARAVTDAPVIVALPHGPHPRKDALAGLDVTLRDIPDASEGMNASLRTAFACLPADTRAAMLLLADMPDLTIRDLNTVLQAVDLTTDTLVWRGATQDGKPGHPVVFAAPLFAAFATLAGDTGGQQIVALAGRKVALVTLPDSDARADLDTPEDWAKWRMSRNS